MNINTVKAQRAVTRVLGEIRHGRPLRSLISRQAEQQLVAQAVVYPTETRGFLKALLRLDHLACPLEKINLPANLTAPQNQLVLARLGETRFLLSLIDEEGSLSFKNAGLQRELGYHDLTKEFPDYQALQKLRHDLLNAAPVELKESYELSIASLYHALWRARILIYQAGEEKGLSAQEGDRVGVAENYAKLLLLASFLNDLSRSSNFFSSEKISDWLGAFQRAAELLRQGNNPAADALLVSLAERLERELLEEEQSRFRRQRRADSPYRNNKFSSSLRQLAERRYRIRMTDEGLVLIPETGWRSAAGVLQPQQVVVRVPLEKVIRREEHQLQSITRQLEGNVVAASRLNELKSFLRRPDLDLTDGHLEKELTEIRALYLKGQVRSKVKTFLVLDLACSLVATARQTEDQSGRRRILAFAGGMVGLAAESLILRNHELLRQLERIASKKKISLDYVFFKILSRVELNLLIRGVLQVIFSRMILDQAGIAWNLRRHFQETAQALAPYEKSDPRLLELVDSLTRVGGLFAKVGVLIAKKEDFRTAILVARQGGHNRLLTREGALAEAADNLTKIRLYDREIVSTLEKILKEISAWQQLVDFNLSLEGFKERLAILPGPYLEVVGSRGEALGLARVEDVERLGLKTKAPV